MSESESEEDEVFEDNKASYDEDDDDDDDDDNDDGDYSIEYDDNAGYDSGDGDAPVDHAQISEKTKLNGKKELLTIDHPPVIRKSIDQSANNNRTYGENRTNPPSSEKPNYGDDRYHVETEFAQNTKVKAEMSKDSDFSDGQKSAKAQLRLGMECSASVSSDKEDHKVSYKSNTHLKVERMIKLIDMFIIYHL